MATKMQKRPSGICIINQVFHYIGYLMFNMLILYRTSYFVLSVEKLGARNSSTKFLPDVLYDDRTACAIGCNRYITHCRYLKLASCNGKNFINNTQ